MKMKSIKVLLLLWVALLSNAKDRLRRFYTIEGQFPINKTLKECTSNYIKLFDKEKTKLAITSCNIPLCWTGMNSCSWSRGDRVTFSKLSDTSKKKICCGSLNTDGTWTCEDCNSTQMYFMCYKKADNQSYTLIRENKTWSEAQLYCRHNHTDLVTIRNEQENDKVKMTANNSFPFWIGLQYNNSNITWFDGGNSDHEGNSIKSNGCISYLYSVQFWVQNNANYCAPLCYKSLIHVSESVMSWEDAMDYCDRNYSGPLLIQSEKDHKETERELRRRNISGPVWVGLRQSQLFGFWIWTNGVQVGPSTKWKGGSAPAHRLSQHCGAIEEVDGQYKLTDEDCRKQLKVLCER